ncbi:MAG TPA: YceI family protein [Acidobacteriaceae bacterium]|nr:YceI family protein [Acidobacteriaceae bacterium]
MKLRCYLLLLSLLASCAPYGLSQGDVLTVAPDQSHVAFTLSDVLHTVHGAFHIQSGTVRFDNSKSQISGSIVVAAGSGQSGNETRDRRMTKDVLDAPQFAVASFTPQRMEGSIAPSGDSTVQVTGIFTLHGTPHELTVPMQVHMDGANCTAKTQFIVPYVKWGLKDPSNFLLKVSKDVTIDLTLVGQLSPAPGA